MDEDSEPSEPTPYEKYVQRLRKLFKRYQDYKAEGEEYPPCPRCGGNRFVYAITNPDPNQMTQWEEFPCPLCGTATGDKEVNEAIAWIRREAEESDIDLDNIPENEV